MSTANTSSSAVLLHVAIAAVALMLMGPAGAVVITPPLTSPIQPSANDDPWDISQGATVNTAASAQVCCGTDLRNIFGGSFGSLGPYTIFGPESGAHGEGTEYAVEWQSLAAVTIRSFHLQAFHDGSAAGADANARGIKAFRLYAYNSSTSLFDLQLFNLELQLGTDLLLNKPAYDPDRVLHPCGCWLDFAANVDQLVTTNRWRAVFVQYGRVNANNSTPRIVELDGLTEFLPGSGEIPAPATLMMMALGLLALSGLHPARNDT